MSQLDLLLHSYNYDLPADRIAQNPCVPRDASRLMVIEAEGSFDHHFYELPQLLRSQDLLVLNNTKVIPASLDGQKPSGGAVKILLVEPLGHNHWLALVKPGRSFPVGSTIMFGKSNRLKATVIKVDEATGGRELLFEISDHSTFAEIIAEIGEMPLPPYINASDSDPEQYQTVYAQNQGAIAAPTAGLHFTQRLLDQLTSMGIAQTYITLHVGVGTFRPVKVDDITSHVMHHEWMEVPESAIAAIKATKARGGRVIGVGTTVARALESCKMQAYQGKTNLMIYPGYEWQVLDGLITNFHLPKSSLMMLVSSFLADRTRLLDLYQTAIDKKYRFYSFGDAMLIWRGNKVI